MTIRFGVSRRDEHRGQTLVDVYYRHWTVGTLRRWLAPELAKHGWFFETNDPLSRDVFSFGFPPGKVLLAEAKKDLIAEAAKHGIGP